MMLPHEQVEAVLDYHNAGHRQSAARDVRLYGSHRGKVLHRTHHRRQFDGIPILLLLHDFQDGRGKSGNVLSMWFGIHHDDMFVLTTRRWRQSTEMTFHASSSRFGRSWIYQCFLNMDALTIFMRRDLQSLYRLLLNLCKIALSKIHRGWRVTDRLVGNLVSAYIVLLCKYHNLEAVSGWMVFGSTRFKLGFSLLYLMYAMEKAFGLYILLSNRKMLTIVRASLVGVVGHKNLLGCFVSFPSMGIKLWSKQQ